MLHNAVGVIALTSVIAVVVCDIGILRCLPSLQSAVVCMDLLRPRVGADDVPTVQRCMLLPMVLAVLRLVLLLSSGGVGLELLGPLPSHR